ncbi:MarR family transcriptional regulator [Alcanivorax hongdengensis A-11-3]|uniref:MarR family transcriptional regulator n=1 Tax=Alcanivorax hongdengensis A-11-3 TaxID=1177179 RepID=L0WIS5_9GAMM|nr:MarR family transcriptional regulator [Alcanivorax hongdengensis]EKF76072.1 MarR family transcriptional regulator [Alcanivorax hongdengensis A-11-3]
MNPDSDIRHALWQLAFQFKVSTKRAIRDYGLPLNGMHVRTLHLIRSQPDCTANQLATITGRDKAQITRLLKELEAMALITRTPHPGDRRSQIVALSDTGRELMARTVEAEKAVEKRLLKGMSKEEVSTFVSLAHKMLENLREA